MKLRRKIMANPTEITFNGKTGGYYSCSYLRELQEKDAAAFSGLKKEGEIRHTVYHRDSDFSEPIVIRKGCGLVNRMGFIIAPEDFLPGDELYISQVKYEKLCDDIREAEMKS
jgi:hypothetical protein